VWVFGQRLATRGQHALDGGFVEQAIEQVFTGHARSACQKNVLGSQIHGRSSTAIHYQAVEKLPALPLLR